jgi:hypothetical protein
MSYILYTGSLHSKRPAQLGTEAVVNLRTYASQKSNFYSLGHPFPVLQCDKQVMNKTSFTTVL